jgi:acetoin utilization deacetylase AcuC-like enzyme
MTFLKPIRTAAMTMNVVFCPEMLAPAQGYSPSAAKPGPVVDAWRQLWPALNIRPAIPATEQDFCRAHDSNYVQDIFDLRADNGFGTRSAEVNASLHYTSGAMLTAARWAINEKTVVAAPVSGFHHAGWDSADGFCTFNGLMVTVLTLQAERPSLRVGILDYDYHYGNGTVDIIDTLSVSNVVHITAGEKFKEAHQASYFLTNIEDDLDALNDCDVVLYQAGADPHIDDPLGGFLTTSQLAQRDWRVFHGLRQRGIPIAWNLAGGYQKPISKVVGIHENTMRACIEVQRESMPVSVTQRYIPCRN